MAKTFGEQSHLPQETARLIQATAIVQSGYESVFASNTLMGGEAGQAIRSFDQGDFALWYLQTINVVGGPRIPRPACGDGEDMAILILQGLKNMSFDIMHGCCNLMDCVIIGWVRGRSKGTIHERVLRGALQEPALRSTIPNSARCALGSCGL